MNEHPLRDGLSSQAMEPQASPPKASNPDAVSILTALRERGASDHIQVEEFAFTGGNRRIDFWDMHVHPSKGHEATSYEIKISRADFKRDNAIKQREARLWSDRFYYVCPKGMMKPDEIPEWAGLMEWDGARLSIRLPAPKRDKDAPSWDLFVSLIRNSTSIRRDADPRLGLFRYFESRNKKLEAENQSLRSQVFQLEAKAIEARSDKTGTGLAVDESADPKGFAQGDQP